MIYSTHTKRYILTPEFIAHFIDLQYPFPPLCNSPPGLSAMIKHTLIPLYTVSVIPRSLRILNMKSATIFRRIQESKHGCTLETLLVDEDEVWDEKLLQLEQLERKLRTLKANQAFLGSRESPCLADFVIAGAIQSARVVNRGVFRRMMIYPGLASIYRSCLPFLGQMT